MIDSIILIQSILLIVASLVVLLIARCEWYHRKLRKTKTEEEALRIVRMTKIGGALGLVGNTLAMLSVVLPRIFKGA